MLLGVLEDQPGPARDIVALNAGAAIYAAGLADTLAAAWSGQTPPLAGEGPAVASTAWWF